MKLKYYYIIIELLPLLKGRVTQIYNVINRKWGDKIGQIKWYGAWRQYCFFPRKNTIWSKSCMKDIMEVLDALEKERFDNFKRRHDKQGK